MYAFTSDEGTIVGQKGDPKVLISSMRLRRHAFNQVAEVNKKIAKCNIQLGKLVQGTYAHSHYCALLDKLFQTRTMHLVEFDKYNVVVMAELDR